MISRHSAAVLACALTAAAAPVCLAGGAGMDLVVDAGSFTNAKTKTLNEETDLGKLGIRGKYGNFATASGACDYTHTPRSFAFHAKARAKADAGPKYWIKDFLKDHGAHAMAMVSSANVHKFSKPVAFTLTGDLTTKPFSNPLSAEILIVRRLGKKDWKVVRDLSFPDVGAVTTTGNLPAGTYQVYASIRVEAGWVGGNFTQGGPRVQTNEAEMTMRLDFKTTAESAADEDTPSISQPED